MSVFKGFFKGKKFNKRTILTKVNTLGIVTFCLLGAYTIHLKDINMEIISALEQYEIEISEKEAENSNLANENNFLHKENSDLINRNEELSNKVSELSRQNESYNLKLNNKDSIINEQKQEIEKLKKSNSNFNEVSRGGDYQKFVVTAYTANEESTGKSPSHPAYGITASGEKVKRFHTIACPPRFEFGTKIYIPYFDNTYTCADRGGAIKGNRLDVYMKNLSDALEFGRRELDVKVQNQK